ncbi:MAG: formate--tetrahydrofolate ligase, partial [Erysipelotrichaceae bacterium]|nr:formate--tetrahydrofolate ligase [Erysipelotrichaceae bacterium]
MNGDKKMEIKTDIQIAQECGKEKITEIAKKVDIDEKYLELYGNYKAKINKSVYERLKRKKNGKLILVTAISPTPLGEGKT